MYNFRWYLLCTRMARRTRSPGFYAHGGLEALSYMTTLPSLLFSHLKRVLSFPFYRWFYFSLRKQKQTEGNFRLLHIIHLPLSHCPHYACLSLQLILGPKSRVACIPDAVSSPRLLSCFSQLYWYAWEMPLSPTWKESVTLSSFCLAPELSVCCALYIFFFGVFNNSSFTPLNSAY